MARPRPNGRPDVSAPTDRDRVLDHYTKHVSKSLASLARLVAAPVEVAAAGSKVQGSDGHTYLDCGGFGVFLLGHCHPVVVAAVREQLGRNPLATRLFLNPELAQAAADLAGITPACGLRVPDELGSRGDRARAEAGAAGRQASRDRDARRIPRQDAWCAVGDRTGAVPRSVRPTAADGRLRAVRRLRHTAGRAHRPVRGAARARPGRGWCPAAAQRLPATGPASVHRDRRRDGARRDPVRHGPLTSLSDSCNFVPLRVSNASSPLVPGAGLCAGHGLTGRAAPRAGQARACPCFRPEGPQRSPGSGPARRGRRRQAVRSSLEAGGAAPYPRAARPPAWNAAASQG